MPRTLGGWLVLTIAVLFWVLTVVNFVLANLVFLVFAYLGKIDGFDRFAVSMCLLFGFIVAGDLFTFFMLTVRQEKILRSLWPNMVVASVRFAYLFVAVALFYGLLVAGNSNPKIYYWILFSVASLFALTNLPWLIFHLALFFPKNRQRLRRMNEEMKCRLKTQRSTS